MRMNTTPVEERTAAETKEKQRKSRGTVLWVLLLIVLLLFLATTALLVSRLYRMATLDQHTVELEIGVDSQIDLFHIEYENDLGEITVWGANGENVVAPGTQVDYDIRLRNNDDVVIDFVMSPNVEYLTDDEVPLRFKLMDSYGNYLLGSEEEWANASQMNQLSHKGSVHPGEVFTYHVVWEWVFETDDTQNAYDTYLGDQDGQVLPGVEVSVRTEASANPGTAKAPSHQMHLFGESFGCCWCCYLVWLLLLVCLVLLLWLWRVRRKRNQQADTLTKYEEVLKRHGLLVDGELVETAYAEQ